MVHCAYRRGHRVYATTTTPITHHLPDHHHNQTCSGVICTTDESVRGNIVQAVAMPGGQRIFPVGRLDKESTGLVCACIVCVCVLCVCFGGAGGDGAMQSLLTGSANTYTYK